METLIWTLTDDPRRGGCGSQQETRSPSWPPTPRRAALLEATKRVLCPLETLMAFFTIGISIDHSQEGAWQASNVGHPFWLSLPPAMWHAHTVTFDPEPIAPLGTVGQGPRPAILPEAHGNAFISFKIIRKKKDLFRSK